MAYRRTNLGHRAESEKLGMKNTLRKKMSELDHGMFFATHRVSDVENLVILMRNGLGRQKYKPVDYKHLYELSAAEERASAKIQLKIKRTEQVSKINKEQMLLRQHQQVWWQEHKRLSESRQKAEAEVKTFLDEESHKHSFFSDMKDLERELSQERDTYQRNTVVPVWQLKENVKLKLSEMQSYLLEEPCLKSKFNPDEMLQQIKSGKKQQEANLAFLVLGSLALERELEDCKPKVLAQSFEEKNGRFLEVPSALLSLECPYPDVKNLAINEYRKLASGYWSKLQETDEQLEDFCRNIGWKEEDQWVFQTVINQYPSGLQRRRILYLDALQRYLPHKSRHELIAYEKAWHHYHFIRKQRRVLLSNWARARKAFLFKAVAMAAEASAAHETEAELANARRKQQEFCADLKAKVLQWKAQQEEAARLEAAVAARRREKKDEEERLQEEQEMIRRVQEKDKVKKYQAEKELKCREQEEKDLQWLEELRKLMAEQAIRDKERVKFRQAVLEKRLLERKELALREAREAEQKERCLEGLRQQTLDEFSREKLNSVKLQHVDLKRTLWQTLVDVCHSKAWCVGESLAPICLRETQQLDETDFIKNLKDSLVCGTSLSAAAHDSVKTVNSSLNTFVSIRRKTSKFGLQECVAVVAKLDPTRVLAHTVASKARMGIGTTEEFNLQKPLFRLHTYSEQQIISDPRLRVELALREAGLHKTLYAREILPKIPPLKLPRRDMESTAFRL